MSEKIANPGALGLGGFALTTFLLSFINAGILDPTNLGVVLGMAFFYGGMAQVLAGMWEFKTGNIFGATCFTSFGSFWLGLALLKVLEAAGIIAVVPAAGLAVFLVAWGLFTLYATFAAIKAPRGLLILFIALTLTFFLLAAGEFSTGFKLAGGYLGILVALIAWYDSAAILINEMYGRKVLPL